ncbi:hypothetical protein FBUS_06878 [Fasciolopsis buskii]|uniref:Uncharacterized protein n=1 Tax=Fasciolopsis buskii TaxID=27845 RepID=A0A8E0VHJ7_9TREM|nr:hypothetical protein FBUS_06878 [Fasciolopsis buski]
MDAMERSHGFESSVVSSLFNARQMIWTELSTVISGRQLQSFYSGRPVCSSCSQPITPIKNAGKLPIASDDGEKVEFGSRPHSHFCGEVEARKRDRRNASLSSNSTEQSEKNPLDIVSLWFGKGFPGRRPSEKRPCVRAYASPSNRQPAVMVKDTEATEDTLESNASQSSDQTPTNVPKSPDVTMDDLPDSFIGDHSNVNDTSVAEPEGQLGITKLSPPSQSYDASLAIRNAVNHLDLANYDNSMVEFIHSQASHAKYSKAGESNRQVTVRHIFLYTNSKRVCGNPPYC